MPNIAYENSLCPAVQIILFFSVTLVFIPYQMFLNFGGNIKIRTAYNISKSPMDAKLLKIVKIIYSLNYEWFRQLNTNIEITTNAQKMCWKFFGALWLCKLLLL